MLIPFVKILTDIPLKSVDYNFIVINIYKKKPFLAFDF